MGRRSNAKLILRLPLMRDRSQPYEAQVLNIFNRIFRRDVPSLGNCDWGYIEVLCWGYQLEEFRTALVNAGKEDFAKYAIHVDKLDRWPSYPINATGDCDLTGIDDSMSYPNLIADYHKEIETLTRKIAGLKKTFDLMTGKVDGKAPGTS